ncbi:AAC(3) family N-acetyltransferase [Kitasatospora sp. CB01950]|uniref:AAC(3) family N-acetyltransferase n=1 Tax=Kitasatospora sp. CB01950 TaxID=1703930 RepID=UPI00093DCF5C|nr:AAC(3) family N-acetyltransferase [Kitasatospora sp. CB01950]
MADHRLDSPHGEHSPLLKLYQSRAQALLPGVPLNRCVAWNLAAGRTPNPPTAIESCVVHTRDDSRTWVRFTAAAAPDLTAPELLDLLETQLPVSRSLVADQPTTLVPVEVGVDLVAAWLTETANRRHASVRDTRGSRQAGPQRCAVGRDCRRHPRGARPAPQGAATARHPARSDSEPVRRTGALIHARHRD